MFNKHSIFFTLAVSLIISLLLVIFTFYAILKVDKTLSTNNMKKKYFPIAAAINQEYHRYGLTQNIITIINDMGLEIIENKNDIDNIFINQDLNLLVKRRNNNTLIMIFSSTNNNYLHIQTPFDEFLIVDSNIKQNEYRWIIITIFVMLLFTILFISYTILKKLLPLNDMRKQIINMGDEDIELNLDIENRKDEVSLLAIEFQKKAKSLKDLKEARNIFIRNIMHELKTPITKGRILTELPNLNSNKEKLEKVFFQLESLIKEFASIEELIAKENKIVKKSYFFDDILENALDILMIDDPDQYLEIEQNNIKLNINFKLFSIAVKNILDNGIKYSNNKQVKIEFADNSISFINSGNKLKYDLENYFEPFFDSEQNNHDSFGVGIYITHNILKAHDFKLSYKHINKMNIFTINY